MAGVLHCNEGAGDYVPALVRFPEEILEGLDAYAAEHRLSRNSAIVFMVSAFVDSGATGRRVQRLTRGFHG